VRACVSQEAQNCSWETREPGLTTTSEAASNRYPDSFSCLPCASPAIHPRVALPVDALRRCLTVFTKDPAAVNSATGLRPSRLQDPSVPPAKATISSRHRSPSGLFLGPLPTRRTRWTYVVSFTPRPLYPEGKSSRDGRLRGPQSQSGPSGAPAGNRATGVQPVARLHTDRAIPAQGTSM
jgi:hypothetical protein